MTQEEMLKKYKNTLADIILSQQLDAHLFEVIRTEEDGYCVVKISLRNSPLIFTIRESITSNEVFQYYYVTMSPTFYATLAGQKFYDFNYIQQKFTEWLNEHVKLYLEDERTPDFWDIQKKMQSILDGIPRDENMYLPYTEQERSSIQQGLKQFPKQLQEHLSLSHEETAIVEEKTAYLSRVIERVGRFDWNNIALSTLISMMIALSLDTEKGRLLFKIFEAIVRKALELLP